MTKKEVIIDTNVLLLIDKLGIDIFHELEMLGYSNVILPGGVLRELRMLMDKLTGRDRISARIAASVIENIRSGMRNISIELLQSRDEMDTDEEIIRIAKEKGASVLTNDKVLKKKLLKEGVTIIYPRGRGKLEER